MDEESWHLGEGIVEIGFFTTVAAGTVRESRWL